MSAPYQLCLRAWTRRGPRFPAYGTAWELANPQVREAYYILQQAIRLGWVRRQPCEVCGAKAQSHHENYDRPLDVTWLCALHHRRRHSELRRAS